MNIKDLKTYLLPIVCIVLGVLILVFVVQPSLDRLSTVKQELVELKKSEERVNELMQVYDDLRNTYQKISDKDKQVLEKALPSNVNNVRLILELERIAELRGLGFKDVDVVLKKDEDRTQPEQSNSQQLRKVEASITLIGNYADFVRYMGDLEKSLRILTIRSIDFRTIRQSSKPTQFEYDITLETYWFVDPNSQGGELSSTGNT